MIKQSIPMSTINAWNGPQKRLNLSSLAWQKLCTNHSNEVAQSRYMVRKSYAITSRYYDFLERLQNIAADVPLKVEDDRLLFIVGHWRSGTTLLHEMLTSDLNLAGPSTYACLNPQHFLLTEKPLTRMNAAQHATRPMDAMKVTWSSPQEDEFALLCLGARSPYEALLLPDTLEQSLRIASSEAMTSEERDEWLRHFTRFTAQVQSQNPGRLLVLKSPPHSLKIPLIRKNFPKARFLHIVRNPFDVAASSQLMWRQLMSIYSLTMPPANISLQTISESLSSFVRQCDDSLANQPSSCTIRYEDLITDPLACLRKVYDTLNLGDFYRAAPGFSDFVDSRRGYSPNNHSISDMDRNMIAATCEPIFTKYSYSI